MDKTNQSIKRLFTDPRNLDYFLENHKELEYILYELLTQGDNIRFIQILTLLKRRLNQITRMSEDNNEKAYKIGYAEGMLNLCMKIVTFNSEKEMKEMNSSENLVENIENNCWHSTLVDNPDEDGQYYVFISNCMDNSNEMRKLEYKNKRWDISDNDYDRILAWKPIARKTIFDEEAWLKNHINEIQTAFHNDKIQYNDCFIAETLEECISEYEYFLWAGYVRFIDDKIVIRII